MRLLPGFVAIAASLLALQMPGPPVHPDGPPPARTGGFGEPTCRSCHFDYPLNEPPGSLHIMGLPEAFQPDSQYAVAVRLVRAGMLRGGFEVSSRFGDGRQAGTFTPTDGRTQVTRDSLGIVQYLHHTLAGTALSAPDTATWSFTWTAPGTAAAPVVFHVAANAANDDDSAFGDHIFADSARVMAR